jgi:hypothetical protein
MQILLKWAINGIPRPSLHRSVMSTAGTFCCRLRSGPSLRFGDDLNHFTGFYADAYQTRFYVKGHQRVSCTSFLDDPFFLVQLPGGQKMLVKVYKFFQYPFLPVQICTSFLRRPILLVQPRVKRGCLRTAPENAGWLKASSLTLRINAKTLI